MKPPSFFVRLISDIGPFELNLHSAHDSLAEPIALMFEEFILRGECAAQLEDKTKFSQKRSPHSKRFSILEGDGGDHIWRARSVIDVCFISRYFGGVLGTP